MTKNIGNTDKLIRLLIAVVLFILVYTGKVTGSMQYVLLVIALIAVPDFIYLKNLYKSDLTKILKIL